MNPPNILTEANNTAKNPKILELEKTSTVNNVEIVIIDEENELFLSNKNYISEFGTINEINTVILESGKMCLELIIQIFPLLAMWMGITEIAILT